MQNFTFKRQLLLVVFMFLGCLAIHATDDELITRQITIKLEKAGTLPDKISSTKKYKLTNIKIVGEINGIDLRFIREMAGRDVSGDVTEGKLAILNLSEAKIVEGGDYYKDNFYTSYDAIGDYAFYNCSGLTSITLPSGVTSIGEGAFMGCSGLTSVTSIGYYAFVYCSGLTSLTLPSSVTSIGGKAFNGCNGLTSVYVSWESPLSIDTSIFVDANIESCILYVPKGTYDDYWVSNWGVFDHIEEYDATGIKQVTTSDDAKEISRYGADGQRLEEPAKGLNIVKYSDGSVKKVVVQ